MRVADAANGTPEPIRMNIEDVTVIFGLDGRCQVTIKVDGYFLVSGWERSDTVDAMCDAFASLMGESHCVSWSSKVGVGENAVCDVLIDNDGERYCGRGEHQKAMFAAARAVSDAFHKCRWYRWRKSCR